jgi:hypothetical protein
MRRASRALACAVAVLAALCAPAVAAASNGQIAAVADGRLVTVNQDGSGVRAQPVTDAGKISELAFSPGGNRIAFIKSGELSVLELATGRVVALTTLERDANPAWSADGLTIGFRRGQSLFRVPAAGGSAPQQDPARLDADTTDIAWAPDLKAFTAVIRGLLAWTGLDQQPAVTGIPAWAPDLHALAFARPGGLSTIAPPADAKPVLEAAAGSPRWSPDSAMLVYPAPGEVRTLTLATGAVGTVLAGVERLGPVDWQPCVAGVTLSCESVAPPRCSASAATATTQADQPIDLPAPPCTDPGGRPLSLVVVKAPDRGTLSGLRYTPAPGFSGQDTVAFRVTNGVVESETYRVTVFVVPRPAPPAVVPATRPPVLVQGAPFLSASATPRLDRKRTPLVHVSCDQDCSFTVRLSATLRTRNTFNGKQVKRSPAAKQVVRLRLRLPSRPRGTLKTVWITGRVRNAAGDVRTVKLPVRLPR